MRITPVSAPYAPEVAEALSKMMPPAVDVEPLSLFRIMARHLRLGRRMTSLGGVFLRSDQLSLRERELVILRVTARHGCEYEWGVHKSWLAAPAGLSDDEVAATLDLASTDAFTGRDALVVRLADELGTTSRVSAELGAALEAEWDEPALVELFALVGFYTLISFVANAAGAELEPWAARFSGARRA